MVVLGVGLVVGIIEAAVVDVLELLQHMHLSWLSCHSWYYMLLMMRAVVVVAVAVMVLVVVALVLFYEDHVNSLWLLLNRKFCGLEPIHSFEALSGYMTNNTAAMYSRLYK